MDEVLIKCLTMKKYYLLAILLALILNGCEKDEIEEPEKKIPYYLGYFEGWVNDRHVLLENNSSNKQLIHGGYFSIRGELETYEWMIPLRPYQLKITLSPLKEGYYKIDNESYKSNIPPYMPQDYVRIINEAVKPYDVYLPLKEPFQIWVDSIRFRNSSIPYIEGKMEGVFFNVEDMNDSIVIKEARFGNH